MLSYKSYPSLRSRFEIVFPNISFETVESQLKFATNDRELSRGLHRLHCFVNILLEKNQNPKLIFLTEFAAEKKEVLLFMLLADSCKLQKEIKDNFQSSEYLGKNSDYKIPMDSVPFFFESLQHAPEIYSFYECLSEEAKKYLNEHIFYLHQRHLQFGEVPVESLSDFQARITDESIGESLALLNAFWTINLLGFDLPELVESQLAEKCSPTMSEERLDSLAAVQLALEQCVKQRAFDPLLDYYKEQLPMAIKASIDDPTLLAYVGRLSMLLKDKYPKDYEVMLQALFSKYQKLLSEAAQAEKTCYERHNLQAITFLPAVFWKLKEINQDKLVSGELTDVDIVVLYLKFQRALFSAFLQITPAEFSEHLKGNRSVPLFGISQDANGILTAFSASPGADLSVTLSVGNFITVAAKVVSFQAVGSPSALFSAKDVGPAELAEKDTTPAP